MPGWLRMIHVTQYSISKIQNEMEQVGKSEQ